MAMRPAMKVHMRPITVAAAKTQAPSKGSKASAASKTATVRDPESTQLLRVGAVVLALGGGRWSWPRLQERTDS